MWYSIDPVTRSAVGFATREAATKQVAALNGIDTTSARAYVGGNIPDGYRYMGKSNL